MRLAESARTGFNGLPIQNTDKADSTDSDKEQRKTMAVKILEKIQKSLAFLNFFWTPDEAHFHLEEKVNLKTNVFQTSRPNKVATKPLHSPKCMVWTAISARGIIRPFFIKESGMTVTVTKDQYGEVLKTSKNKLIKFNFCIRLENEDY